MFQRSDISSPAPALTYSHASVRMRSFANASKSARQTALGSGSCGVAGCGVMDTSSLYAEKEAEGNGRQSSRLREPKRRISTAQKRKRPPRFLLMAFDLIRRRPTL